MTTSPDHEDLELRQRLRALRVELPDDGFEAALHGRLLAAAAPRPPRLLARLHAAPWRGRLLWPAFGLAAGVAAFLTLELLRGPLPGAPLLPAVTVAEVPATKVAVIRLDLSAEVAVQRAEIQVRLPAGLVFWSDGQALAERTYQWTQPLAAGENQIPIAVRGQRPGRYRVMVSALAGGEWIEHEVLLQVTDG